MKEESLREMEGILRRIMAGEKDLRIPPLPEEDPLQSLGQLINQLLDRENERLNQKAQSHNQLFKFILDEAPIEVVILDAEWRYVYVNPKAVKDREVREWMIGKTDLDWARHRNRPLKMARERKRIFDLVVTKGEPQYLQQEHLLPEGKMLHYYRSMLPIFGSDGKVTFVFGFGLDITSLKEKEDELSRTNEELKKINYELDQFVYRSAHDLRAPLLNILGMTQVAEQHPAELPHYLNLIRQSAQYLDQLIGNIVDYSKNSHLLLSPEKIDLQAESEQMLQELMVLENAQDLEFSLEVMGEVPFFNDLFRFQKLIKVLLSNAIRFRDQQKESHQVQIHYTVTPEILAIRIGDNGCGIPHEYQDRLFEIFFRGSNKGKGSGLGLFIAKEITDRLGGKLEFTSTPGEGTVFQATIPNMSQTPAAKNSAV